MKMKEELDGGSIKAERSGMHGWMCWWVDDRIHGRTD